MNYTTFWKTLVIASMTAALALAQPPGRGFGPPSAQGSVAAAPTLDNAKQYLGLSDTEVANLEALRKASREDIRNSSGRAGILEQGRGRLCEAV